MAPYLKSKKIKQFIPLKFEENNAPKLDAKKKKKRKKKKKNISPPLNLKKITLYLWFLKIEMVKKLKND